MAHNLITDKEFIAYKRGMNPFAEKAFEWFDSYPLEEEGVIS
jgi:hypothetical protein